MPHFQERDLDALLIEGLEDGRLLLLIDGLDEYAQEQAARVTLMTLETFARTHGITVIATGRPAGVKNLNLRGGWRMGRLMELSIDQQRLFAERLLADIHPVTEQRRGDEPLRHNSKQTAFSRT